MSNMFWKSSSRPSVIRRGRVFGVVGAFTVAATLAVAGHLRADAPPGRYTTSGGTAVDVRTHLEWQQGTAPALPASGKPLYTWQEASAYCAALALKGSGWRLPSVKELHSLEDRSRPFSVIDPMTFPVTTDQIDPGGPGSYYWTGTKVHNTVSDRWKIYFGDGRPRPGALTEAARVRCVRTPQ